LIFRSYPNKFK